MIHSSVRVAPEVASALAQGRAVVALESTLIAHGLPWPENLETALGSEEAVRKSGSVPATIAVLGGQIRVGLSTSELEHIARAEKGTILKAGRRDLSIVSARGIHAATTVSATLWVARSCGIQAMATGGLGGVHRGAEKTFDISMDLDELARADGVVLVCSGVKSILDIAATLETMETRGIAVIGYQTDTFPAFTTPSSGLPVEWRADSPDEVAAIVRSHRSMHLPGAIVLAQEVSGSLGIAADEMNTAIDSALLDANDRKITGKEITPFLLNAVRLATEGRSLKANRALIIANAGLAGEVAASLA